MRVRAFALGWSMALAGCGPAATFICATDHDCRDGERIGVCEADHYCSFPDGACASGRRYGKRAPSDLAEACVPDSTASDGGTTTGAGDSDSGDTSTSGPATTTSGVASSSEGASTSSTSMGDTGPIPTPWWDTAWSHRIAITVSFDGATDELVDVPVLAVLTDDRFDAGAATADGSDVRFVSADHTEQFPHQIDTWSVDGSRLVWFRMPVIGGNDTLWLYYGNPEAMDVSTPDVWGSDHVAVFHMGEAIDDASGVLGAPIVQGVAGPGALGDATVFDALGGAAELGDLDPLRELFFTGASFSAWIRPTAWGVGGNWGRIFDKMDLPSDGNGYSVMVEAAGRFRFVQGFMPGESGWETNAGTLALDQWSYVSLSYHAVDVATPPAMYIDGVAQELTQNFVADGAPLADDGVPAAIGGRLAIELRTFEGSIDELRIESIERPPQWHQLQYMSMTDTLLHWGRTETQR